MPPSINIAAKDARVDLKDERIIRVINEGPSSSTYQAFNASSQSNTSSTIFQINPPSTHVGVGRYLRLRIVGSARFTGTGLATNTEAVAQVALRAWPLANAMSSCQVQINNANIAYSQQASFMPAFARVSNPVINQNTYQSGTATNPDLFTNYNDITGSINSPFASALAIPSGEYVPHTRTEQITALNYGVFADPAPGQPDSFIDVAFDISEPILVAPFCADASNVEAIYGISQMNIAINWANIQRMFSVALVGANASITTFNPAFASQQLLLNYVSPHANTITHGIPTQVYNCPGLQLYQTTAAVDLAGPKQGSITNNVYTAPVISTTQANTNTITLPRCPRLAILWVTDVPGVNITPPSACTVPDRCYPISNVSVNCYDKSGLLAGADARQLYEMSVAAGLNATQAQFLGLPIYGNADWGAIGPAAVYTGAPLVIDFTNLSLPDGIAPGVDIQTQLQISFTVANNLFATNGGVGQALTNIQVNLLIVTDGYLTNSSNGSSEWVLGGLHPSDVKHARESSDTQYRAIVHQQTRTTLLGGSFWDTLKNIGRTALSVAAPIASAVAPELAPVIGIASKLAGAGKLSKSQLRHAANHSYY